MLNSSNTCTLSLWLSTGSIFNPIKDVELSLWRCYSDDAQWEHPWITPGSGQRGCLVIQTPVFSPEQQQQVGLDWSFNVLKQCYLMACRKRNLIDIADAARLMASAAGPSAGLLSKYIASVIRRQSSQLLY